MKILVIGRGGREHAIIWKIAQSPLVSEIYAAPGNAGIKSLAKCVNITETDIENLVFFAKEKKIDLCFVGPESSLVAGIVDEFQKAHIPIFGPTQAAARIESSKEFAKELMLKYHIPTAAYQSFNSYDAALAYIHQKGTPIVIKYDGLAAGKGVVVAMNMSEAEAALKDMLLNNKFGKDKVIIEDYLEGIEFSLLAFVHNNHVIPMVISQDHKRAFDGDKGPNTGGMGAYSPVPAIPQIAIQDAVTQIMQTAADGMIMEGCPFTGILYGGLILTSNGVKVIEFNCRFGDPETEVVLPKMESDIVQIVLDMLNGKIPELKFSPKVFVGVVMASKGYPGSSQNGFEIQNIDTHDLIFHMGTLEKEGHLYTNGGRVLCIIGNGKTFEEAQNDAYTKVKNIKCENLFYRQDIGNQFLKI